MKRLLKKLARTLWLISAPVRRPVIRRFDHHMMQLLSSVSMRGDAAANHDEALSRIDLALRSNDLALSSVVRELARLQIRVEILQQQIDDLELSGWEGARPESRLSVVGENG